MLMSRAKGIVKWCTPNTGDSIQDLLLPALGQRPAKCGLASEGLLLTSPGRMAHPSGLSRGVALGTQDRQICEPYSGLPLEGLMCLLLPGELEGRGADAEPGSEGHHWGGPQCCRKVERNPGPCGRQHVLMTEEGHLQDDTRKMTCKVSASVHATSFPVSREWLLCTCLAHLASLRQ